jgi:hypothetical protein
LYNIELFEELTVFDDITYYDEPHKYYFKGSDKPLTSGTQLIAKYKKPFEREIIAKKVSAKTGQPVDEIYLEWESSGIKGTCVHEYAENLIANKIFPYPKEQVIADLGVNMGNIVEDKFIRTMPIVDRFCEDTKGKLINIRSELVMGDRDYWIGGMADQLYYNKKSGELEIWDWKTNKKIDTYNKYGTMLNGLEHLDTSKLTEYSLQLSLYKHIIEKNTNLKLGKSYICWFNENNPTYKVFECHDLSAEVDIMIKRHLEESNDVL